jgi:hypothetical protein
VYITKLRHEEPNGKLETVGKKATYIQLTTFREDMMIAADVG